MPSSLLGINTVITLLFVGGLSALVLTAVGYILFTFFRYRGREEKSLDSVLLQVAIPRNNEIKIDAMEQIFASIYSVKKGGWKQRFSVQPTISFEMVGRHEDIRFYVWVPKSLKDLVERQIHGGFSDAQILEVE